MFLLSWHSLMFLIPLGIGSLLGIGAALGLTGDGAAPVGDLSDVADLEEGDPASSLAVGRVPLTVRLMLLSLSFGGIGLSLTYLLGGLAQTQLVPALIAAGGAAAGAWWISGRVARLFARRVPLLESEALARRDLLGATGRAVLAVGPVSGLAQVHDRHGNLHQVTCRTLGGEAGLPAGTELLLVDYDQRRGLYHVASNPLGVRSKMGADPPP